MVGVNGIEIDSQIQFVRECCPAELREQLRLRRLHDEACRLNGEGGYGPVEAEFLFSFIVSKRPSRIVQVGSGVSTAVILFAAQAAGYQPEVLSIDPFPTDYLKRSAEAGLIKLIAKKVEEVDLTILTDVSEGDLLFIDSTHAVRVGGDVNRIVLEVLPRLKPGVFVHFHDIYFPFDYQASVLTTLFFSTESTLLHAFLINNDRYRIAVSLSMLHHACPDTVKSVLPNYTPALMDHGLSTPSDLSGHFPSSTWLEVLE
jgi:hypothetical protein